MYTKSSNKIVIIGTGFVGSTIAFTLMHSTLITELVLIDIDNYKAEGEAMDLSHGLSFLKPIDIKVGNYKDCKDADIIIITAGPSIKKGETRLDLASKNSKIIESIMKKIVKKTTDSIILIVTNPVDILTYIATKCVKYDSNKIIGSGTVLDSSRFRYLLSKHCKVDTRNIHGYIIGEHGDSEVAAWSLTNISGIRLDKYCPLCNNSCNLKEKSIIFDEVKNSAYEILKRKKATHYGVSLATKRIVEAILRNENSILTVSSLLNGEYNISNICLSIPTIVNRKGIEKKLELPLEKEELALLKKSANKLKSIAQKLC